MSGDTEGEKTWSKGTFWEGTRARSYVVQEEKEWSGVD